jgi:hypothetical protein
VDSRRQAGAALDATVLPRLPIDESLFEEHRRARRRRLSGESRMNSAFLMLPVVLMLTLVGACTPSIPPTSPEDLLPLKTALCQVQDALAELDQRNRDPRRKLAVVPDEVSVTLALTKLRTNQGGLQANLSPALAASFATSASISPSIGTTATAQGINTITIKFRHFLALHKDTVLGANIDDQGKLINTAELIVGPVRKTSTMETDLDPCPD